jgi:hypothetical protein
MEQRDGSYDNENDGCNIGFGHIFLGSDKEYKI